jgi:hypothetical protein
MASGTLIHKAPTSASKDGAARIAELWSDLPEVVQTELLERAEAAARSDEDVEFHLTPDELASVEAARRDFAEGRTMTHEEVVASMAKFLKEFP